MAFITIRHTFEQSGTICRTELQQIVYRSEKDPARGSFDRTAGLVERGSEATWSTAHTLCAPTLFRYSALTVNAHRIHHDAPYIPPRSRDIRAWWSTVHSWRRLWQIRGKGVGDPTIRESTFRLQHHQQKAQSFISDDSEMT